MIKFSSSEDEDFQTICGYLVSMVNKAPQKIAEKWKQDKRHEGRSLPFEMYSKFICYICFQKLTWRHTKTPHSGDHIFPAEDLQDIKNIWRS
jgi:hypothetical protein